MSDSANLETEGWTIVDTAARAVTTEELSATLSLLTEVESRLRDARKPELRDVLSAVVSQRITVFHQLGDMPAVVRLTTRYMEEFTDSVDDDAIVLFRLSALHKTEAHEEELSLAAQKASRIDATDILTFVEPLILRHSAEWQWTPELVAKTVDAMAHLRPYPPNSSPVREAWNLIVRQGAQSVRDLNRARTEENLRRRQD